MSKIWWSGFLLTSAIFALRINLSDAKCLALECTEECDCTIFDENNCKTCECGILVDDMCLSEEQYNWMRSDGRQRGLSSVIQKWTNMQDADGFWRVPYSFDDDIATDAAGRERINAAVGVLQALSCIRFDPQQPGDSGSNVRFVNGGGCSSSVGRRNNGQSITLAQGCRQAGTILHEMFHALAVWHEQSRPDRDQFVEIQYDNIESGFEHNFDKLPSDEVNSLGSPYDFLSIMHYSSRAFSSNNEQTIVRRTGNGEYSVQRSMLSQEDITQINAFYNCNGLRAIPETTNCYHPLDRGVSYRGTESVASSGQACLRWDSFNGDFNLSPDLITGAGLEENYCRNPDVSEDGPWCYVSQFSRRFCNIPLCDPAVGRAPEPSPGMWSDYGNWTDCSVTCGTGVESRFRTCIGGVAGSVGCPGSTFETRSCDEGPCTTPTQPPTTAPPVWRNWGRWSSCSEPCGQGVRYRSRRCRSGDCAGEVLRTEGCNVQDCPLIPDGDCYDSRDRDSYRGNATTAIKKGIVRTCRNWMDTTTLPEDYPDKDLQGNLCRNPKNRKKPYCHYTRKRIANCQVSICNTKANWRNWQRWSACSEMCGGGLRYRTRACRRGQVTQNDCIGKVIEQEDCNDHTCPVTMPPPTPTTPPVSNEDCANLDDPQSYRGNVARTRGGSVCQRWDSQSPNTHSYSAQDRIDLDLSENYCRAPEDGDIYPWCFSSTSNNFDYCDIPMCPPVLPLPLVPGDCFDPDDLQSYYGDVTTTKEGDECMRWDGNQPWNHSYKPYNYPDKGLGPHNYCRNPDNDSEPWCVTTNPNNLWGFCDVPTC